MATDREENHDVAAANPAIVKDLLNIIADYAKSEVTIEEAGKTEKSIRSPPPTAIALVYRHAIHRSRNVL